MDDCRIIELLTSNSEDGIKEAITKYRGLSFAIVSRIIGNPSDCEECVADVFISVWNHRNSLSRERSLKGYIIITSRNSAINKLKQISRHPSLPLDDAAEVSDDTDIYARFDLCEDIKQLEKDIAKLKKPHNEILIRRFFLFESIGEIAAQVGLTEKQIKNSLYQSKQKLKKHSDKELLL